MNIHWIFSLICTLAVLHASRASSRRVVCYYTNWSAYRPGLAKFLPQNINPHLCTHLIYAFGGFTNEFMLKPFDKWQDIDQGGYAKFNGLKAHNKNLKTLLAIGGWNEGSQRFSKLVADPEARQNLVKSAIRYLRQHNFDGLDLDWEYPASRDGSKPADKANYALLVKELREGFNKESTGNRPKLLLTMAVPAGFDTIESGYDIRSLNRDLDFMNILSYDYHSAFEPQVNHHAPLRSLTDSRTFDPNEDLNVDATVQLYLRNGASPDKLVVGIPTYGRAFKLVSDDATDIGSPADGPAEAGKATREKGYLAYYEICEKVGVSDWTVEKPDPDALGPYAYKDGEWVGFDDEEMAAKKAQYVLENGLGGVMFWSVDNDDFRGLCTGKKYPLIESAKTALLANDNATPVRGSNRKPSNKNSQSRRPSSGQRQPTSVKRVSTTTVRTTTSNIFTTPEPPTTPDSVADFECKDEGFFPNPKDCKKYFWCLDSPSGLAQHIFTCPSGLHFNKFTDSCDYATNVACKVPSASAAASVSTARPFLAKVTSLGTKPTTTTTTTTTTPEPEFEEYDEEEEAEPIEKEDDEDFSSPEELQQLLQLISDLGGVEAVKQLLERSTGRGNRGRQENGQEIRLSSAQRQALEKVIRPTTVSSSSSKFRSRDRPAGEAADVAGPPSRSPGLKYVTLSRQRTTTTPEPEEEEEELEEEEEPVTRGRLNVNREPIQEVPSTSAGPASRATLPLTTLLPNSFAQGGRISASTAATTVADLVSDAEDYETDATDESDEQLPETSITPPIATTPTVELTTTATTTTTTAPTTTTTTATTTTTTTTTTERTTTTEPANLAKRIKAIRGRLQRPRPVASAEELPRAVAADQEDEGSEIPPVRTPSTTRRPAVRASTTRTPSTRAPIKIAIPAPEGRLPGDEVFRRPSASDQDDLFGTGNTGNTDPSPAGIGNHNGNVVEIDEDGRVFCFDVGNFAYPDDCRKFVQCAKENGVIRGWVHTCPRILSFDPVGAICNWGSPLRCLKV